MRVISILYCLLMGCSSGASVAPTRRSIAIRLVEKLAPDAQALSIVPRICADDSVFPWSSCAQCTDGVLPELRQGVFIDGNETLLEFHGCANEFTSAMVLFRRDTGEVEPLPRAQTQQCTQFTVDARDYLLCPDYADAEGRDQSIKMVIRDLCNGNGQVLFTLPDTVESVCEEGRAGVPVQNVQFGGWISASNVLAFTFGIRRVPESTRYFQESCSARRNRESLQSYLDEALSELELQTVAFEVTAGVLKPTDTSSALVHSLRGEIGALRLRTARSCD